MAGISSGWASTPGRSTHQSGSSGRSLYPQRGQEKEPQLMEMRGARGVARSAQASGAKAPPATWPGSGWQCLVCGALESKGGCGHDFELYYDEVPPAALPHGAGLAEETR